MGHCCSVATSGPILCNAVDCSTQKLPVLHHLLEMECPSPTLGVHANSCPLSQWWHPTISSSVTPFSSFQSFPASGSFPMSWLFTSGSQNIGASASASVLPMNIQDCFPSRLTGVLSLLNKGLSRVFSTTVFELSINSSVLSFLYGPALTPVHDYWKNHSLNYTDLCRQGDVSAF